MPLYEYQCASCGERFEVIQKFSDPPVDACARCGKGPVERLLSSPAIQFKGSGWYITDYSQKGKAGSEAASDRSDAKTDAAKTDAAKTGAGKTDGSKADAPKSESSAAKSS